MPFVSKYIKSHILPAICHCQEFQDGECLTLVYLWYIKERALMFSKATFLLVSFSLFILLIPSELTCILSHILSYKQSISNLWGMKIVHIKDLLYHTTNSNIYVCIYTNIYIWIYVFVYTYLYIDVCIHKYMHMYIYIYI